MMRMFIFPVEISKHCNQGLWKEGVSYFTDIYQHTTMLKKQQLSVIDSMCHFHLKILIISTLNFYMNTVKLAWLPPFFFFFQRSNLLREGICQNSNYCLRIIKPILVVLFTSLTCICFKLYSYTILQLEETLNAL